MGATGYRDSLWRGQSVEINGGWGQRDGLDMGGTWGYNRVDVGKG